MTPTREQLDAYLKTRGDGTRRSTDPATPPRPDQTGPQRPTTT